MKPSKTWQYFLAFVSLVVLPIAMGFYLKPGEGEPKITVKTKVARQSTVKQNTIPLGPITTEVIPTEAVPTEAVPVQAPQRQEPQPPTEPKPKVAAANNTVKVATITEESCSGQFTQKFLCLLNEYRNKAGLKSVTLNSQLTAVATTHSAWMSDTGIFSHEGKSGDRFFDRCAVAGIDCRAENLAEGILEAQKLLDSWIANPSHNKNLLGSYTTIGFGISGKYVTLLLN